MIIYRNNAINQIAIKQEYVVINRHLKGMLYIPQNIDIGIIMVHSDVDYTTFDMCIEMAKRGYLVYGGKVANSDSVLDDKILNIQEIIQFLKAYGCKKVILMGHSGGATLMSAYQAIACSGNVFSGKEMVYPCQINEPLMKADGIMLIDSNFGNGAMTLLSVDPAVKGNNGLDLDEKYLSLDNLEEYFKAQGKRNNEIISKAKERLDLINQGKGDYLDDEPYIVPGGSQIGPCNKGVHDHLELLSHTKEAYDLIHSDGSITHEVIYSLREKEEPMNLTPYYHGGLEVTTVKHFLSERSVLAGPNYHISETGLEDVLWQYSYDCPPNNVRFIDSPMLIMGMSGGYECIAAEVIYQNALSNDKTIAFVKGASHMFKAIDPKYGKTDQALYDYMAKWLKESF